MTTNVLWPCFLFSFTNLLLRILMALLQAPNLLVVTLLVLSIADLNALAAKTRHFTSGYSEENKEKSQVKATVVNVPMANIIDAAVGFPTGIPMGQRIDQKTYVTQFDTTRNIPFYSAYVITAVAGQKIGTLTRSDSWVADIPALENAPQVYEFSLNEGTAFQIEKGHMNPSFINSFDKQHMRNTFHLSNAAPQYKTSNREDWNDYESWLAKFTKEECATKKKGTMYIFTGTSNNYVGQKPYPIAPESLAKPSKGKKQKLSPEQEKLMQIMLKKIASSGKTKDLGYPDISIPHSIWTVACCVFSNGVESMAVWTNNHWVKTQLRQTEMAVRVLAKRLKESRFTQDVVFFPKVPACSLEINTVVLGSIQDTEE